MRFRLASAVWLFAFVSLFVARRAEAFCGFFVSGADAKLTNDATMVVLMREGTRTVLSMQNDYAGPPENFALVIPVPVVLQKDNVKTLSKSVFEHIDALGAPRLVEYWEQDPCRADAYDNKEGGTGTRAKGEEGSMGGPANRFGTRVTVEAKFAVGEYEIVILSAKDSVGLDGWLREERYAIPPGAEAALRPYVAAGSKFFVAKVDVNKVRFDKGKLRLSPLRFHYDSDAFALPVRLGLLNSAGTQDLIVNVLARSRFEVANYPNAFIPTNIDVDDATRAQFPAFYAALFDRTLEKNPRAVMTEYAWQANGCDPCPTPPVSDGDVKLLGGDVLPGLDPFKLTLTRLHARYTKDALGEDLVFRAAPPAEGGREYSARGTQASVGADVGQNNFQARYVIRHPWTGPIRCSSPMRGDWGGPPNGRASSPASATDLSSAPRGAFSLEAAVRTDVPQLDLSGGGSGRSPWLRAWIAFAIGAALGLAAMFALLRKGATLG